MAIELRNILTAANTCHHSFVFSYCRANMARPIMMGTFQLLFCFQPSTMQHMPATDKVYWTSTGRKERPTDSHWAAFRQPENSASASFLSALEKLNGYLNDSHMLCSGTVGPCLPGAHIFAFRRPSLFALLTGNNPQVSFFSLTWDYWSAINV